MDSSGDDPTATAVAWLLSSNEPAVRHLTRRDVLGDGGGAAAAADAAQILEGPKVRALLAGQQPDGGFGVGPTASGAGPTGGWCRWWGWPPRPASHACSPPPRPCWTG